MAQRLPLHSIQARPRNRFLAAEGAAIVCVCIVTLVMLCSKGSAKQFAELTSIEGIGAGAVGAPDIRVAVLKDVQSIRISTGASEARILGQNGIELRRLPANSNFQFSTGPAGLILPGGQIVNDANITVESLALDQRLRLNEQEMAPRLIVHRPPPSRMPVSAGMTVIARLNLEAYLEGVLAGEVPVDRWRPEALKAQAIASRSYAYYELKKNVAEPYDVECTVMSQMFCPGGRCNPAAGTALLATQGLVLTINNALFPAYFHSTCGGHTEAGLSVFPDQPAARAVGAAVCAYCAQSPYYRWQAALNKDALEQKLKAAYPSIGKLLGVEFYDATGSAIEAASGNPRRAASVRVRHTAGVLQLPGNQFRLLAGPRELKSLLFEQVTDRGRMLEISGGGFGHGVGLCQFGSQGLAQAGRTYPEILGLYYPGASLKKMY